MSIIITTKRVGKLLLKAPTEDSARHCAILIEDALNTATIPGADLGWIVLIRQLDLGMIRPGATSMDLSLHIEKVFRNVVSSAVYGDTVNAGSSDVVVFRDITDAAKLFIHRYAARQSVHDWFWPEVFPELKRKQSPVEQLITVVDSVISSQHSIIVTSILMEQILKSDLMMQLMTAVSDAVVKNWLYHLKLDNENYTVKKSDSIGAYQSEYRKAVQTVSKGIQEFGTQNIRSFFLAAVALVKAYPALQARNEFSSIVLHSLSNLDDDVANDNRNINFKDDTRAVSGATSEKERIDQAGETYFKNENALEENLYVDNVQKDQYDSPENNHIHTKPQESPEESVLSGGAEESVYSPKTDKWVFPGQWTPNAGLLFLVPVMERLGILEFIEVNSQHGDVSFAVRLLLFIGKKLGMAQDDPFMVLGDVDDWLVESGSEMILPEKLRNMIKVDNVSIDRESVYTFWLRGIRHWCRLYLKMGLYNLIKRPGQVSITSTHIDVCFELDQTDIRIRRLALDIDPGWVFWIGRVIRFHYGDKMNG